MRAPRKTPARRAVPLCVLALALTGCGDQERTTVAGQTSQVSPAPTSTTAPPTLTPTTPTPTTPTAKPTTPPCNQNKGWSSGETLKWVKSMVKIDNNSDIALGLYSTAGTVCKAIPVQVEFWQVGLSDAGKTFDMKSVLRKQVALDGRRVITVQTPANLKQDDCSGTITAVYVGKPLRTAELPQQMDIYNQAAGADVKFRSNRIAYQIAAMPTPEFGLDTNDFLADC